MLTRTNHQNYAPPYTNSSFSASQYQTNSSPQKIYYNYPTKKHHYDEYASNKDIGYRNIPSFGDGPNCRGFIKNTHAEENSYFENVRKRSLYSLDHHQQATIENHNKYDYDNRNQYKSLGRGSKVGLEKVTQQREQNIDRINKKIKRILDTLNEEEKKMAGNIDLKSDKHYRAYPQNNHRIKTEGTQNYSKCEIQRNYSQTKSHLKYNQQPKKNYVQNVDNIYGKLIDIREKYQTGFPDEERRLLGELTNKPIQRKLKTEVDKNRNFFSPTITVQSPPKVKQNSHTPFKLLKGANVKSTDSLSMISSVYLNHERIHEDRKLKVGVRQVDWEKNEEESTSKKYGTQEHKHQVSSNFGQSRNRAIEVTPQRNIQRSISRYEKSQKSCKLSNGKDLDVEIERIQKKMDNFQQIKKQLKIEDSKNSLKSKQRLNASLIKYKQTRNSKEKTQSTPKRSFIVNSPYQQINKNKPSQFSYAYEQQAQKQQKYQLLKALNPTDQYESIQINLPKPFIMSSNRNTKRAINNSIIKQIESAIISENRFSKNSQAIQSLVLNLCSQIQLDSNFRNSKKWFFRKIGSSKWNELNEELRKFNIHLNQSQLHQIFTMAEQEDNPFHTTRQEEGTYQSLAENYIKACQFWEQNIRHKYIRRQIENCLKDMDIQKRNIVCLYDMVRYINLESDKDFRNRDLFLIFKRFSQGKKEVGLDDVLGQFCQF